MNNKQTKKPLWREIKRFSAQKIWLAVLLLILGLLGLVLPVVPGILLLAVAVFLIKPEWYERLKRRFDTRKQ